VAAALWAGFAVAVHPLMGIFLVALAATVLLKERAAPKPLAFVAFPLISLPPAAWRAVLATHPYLLLANWAWYEWLGILAPLVILVAMSGAVRRHSPAGLPRLLEAVAAFEAVFLSGALFISMPGPLDRFSEIQPMRCLLLVYVVMFLVGGCLLGRWVLGRHAWRWAVLYVPICAAMAMAQVQLFPASSHLELPWDPPSNLWAAGFEWVRTHTPADAFFALDPDYDRLPGEDVHGFRAIAQRSMMADNGKDSASAGLFPSLAVEWSRELASRRGWRRFQRADFLRLRDSYGVGWVVLEQPGARGLSCPYQNALVLVCRVE
jgi:hypothetical protein